MSTQKLAKYINETINSDIKSPIVTYDELVGRLKYDSNIKADFNPHIGQRKLFLNELYFLSHIHEKVNYVIYVGAAPGTHVYFLSALFRRLKFILYDPRRFDISISGFSHHMNIRNDKYVQIINKRNILNEINDHPKARIFMIEDFFTNEDAKILSELDKFAFVSDIRTEGDDGPTDLDIIWNSAQQFNWINIMKPAYYSLKFRCPFFISKYVDPSINQMEDFKLAMKHGIDFIEDYNKGKFRYIEGRIFLQPFAPKTSAETRIIATVRKSLNIIEYDTQEYEEKMFYYNIIERPFSLRTNNNLFSAIGFDSCQDCALENYIWIFYTKNVESISVQAAVETLNKNLKRNLFVGKHGLRTP